MKIDIRCTQCSSINIRALSKSVSKGKEQINYLCAVCDAVFNVIASAAPFEAVINYKTNEASFNSLNLREFPSGATRDADADSERYDLLPPEPVKRRALIMAEGAAKHGDNNWKKGLPISVCLNHLERHLNLYKSGDTSEDHLAKVTVNADFIMYFEEHGEETND